MRFQNPFVRNVKPYQRPLSYSEVRFQDLESYGDNFLRQLTRAVKEESLLLQIISVAWVAGPVTYIALKTSFWVGYGKEPPEGLIFYLGVYAVVTGLITIGAKVINRAVTQERAKTSAALVSDTIARIPDLIFMIRNLRISRLAHDKKVIQSALLILRDPDASESSVRTAIEDLTHSPELAQSFEVIEAYRKKGAYARIQLEVDKVMNKHRDLLLALWTENPNLRVLMEQRLKGGGPSKKRGQKRRYHFLKRLRLCSTEATPQQIALVEGEELLKLMLELLLDREFKTVMWNFEGDSSLWQLFKKLDRRNIRLEQFRKEKRQKLGQLVEAIAEQDDSVFAIFESLNHRLLTNSLKLPERLRGMEAQFAESAQQISLIDRQIQRQEELVVATKAKLAEELKARREDDGRLGIRIESASIKLTDRQKLALAQDLAPYIFSILYRTDRIEMVATSEDGRRTQQKPLGVGELRTMIFKMFLILDKHIDLDREYILDSLEASRSFNLMILDPAFSKQAKIGWMTALLAELEDDTTVALERSALRLIDQCGPELPSSFKKTYELGFGVDLKAVQERA